MDSHAMDKGRVIVIQFVTLDGVVENPEGWAFRSGPRRVAADDFRLGSILDTGVLLFGRTTWDVFSRRWPHRSDPYADAMNRIEKLVVSRTTPPLDAWNNSSLLAGELVAGVAALTRERDVVVVGSTSVVHALATADVVDEYRLLVIPTALGTGARLFVAPVELHLSSIETVGEAVLVCYDRPRGGVTSSGAAVSET